MKLIEDKASEWRLTLKHECGSTFEIDRDDIIHKHISGEDSSSESFHVVCPACDLEKYIPYGDLPGWVQSYAMRNKNKKPKKETTQ